MKHPPFFRYLLFYNLAGFLDNHAGAIGTGDGTMNQDEVAFRIDFRDGQMLNRCVLAAHTARQLLAGFHTTAGAGTHGANGTRFAMGLGTVFHRAASEIMKFDRACKALAAGYAADVDDFTGCKDIGFDYVTNF